MGTDAFAWRATALPFEGPAGHGRAELRGGRFSPSGAMLGRSMHRHREYDRSYSFERPDDPDRRSVTAAFRR